jgi:hypothetical protein
LEDGDEVVIGRHRLLVLVGPVEAAVTTGDAGDLAGA